MTNEQLVLSIQQGNTALYNTLYEQMKKLLYRYANRYYMRYLSRCSKAGITLDDLLQESYIALTEAVQYYNENRGYKFTSYINYPLQNRFNEILGYRTHKNDVLNIATSIDIPVSNNADNTITVADMIEDTTTHAQFEVIEYTDLQIEVHKCIKKLDLLQQNIIKARFFNDIPPQMVHKVLNLSQKECNTITQKAYRELRKSHTLRSLYKEFAWHYYHLYDNTYYYNADRDIILKQIKQDIQSGKYYSYGEIQSKLYAVKHKYKVQEYAKLKQ